MGVEVRSARAVDRSPCEDPGAGGTRAKRSIDEGWRVSSTDRPRLPAILCIRVVFALVVFATARVEIDDRLSSSKG